MHIFWQSSCSLRQQLMQEVEGRLREEKIKALMKERYSIVFDQYITSNEIIALEITQFLV